MPYHHRVRQHQVGMALGDLTFPLPHHSLCTRHPSLGLEVQTQWGHHLVRQGRCPPESLRHWSLLRRSVALVGQLRRCLQPMTVQLDHVHYNYIGSRSERSRLTFPLCWNNPIDLSHGDEHCKTIWALRQAGVDLFKTVRANPVFVFSECTQSSDLIHHHAPQSAAKFWRLACFFCFRQEVEDICPSSSLGSESCTSTANLSNLVKGGRIVGSPSW